MAVSQNGYSANDRSVIASYTVPGTALRISLRKGDVSVVLLEYLRRYNLEVEPLTHVPQDLWGYAERPIRGGTELSNHASGTAVDARATAHPLGKVGTFTAVQRAALDKLLAWFEGVLRHGKNYTGRKDEMHAEINKGMSEVARIANKIRALAGRPTTPAPAPAPSGPAQLVVDGDLGPATIRRWQQVMGTTVDGVISKPRSSLIEAVQKRLNAAPGTGLVKVDGDLGPKTITALQRYLGTTVDGVISKPRSSVIEALQRRLNEGRF